MALITWSDSYSVNSTVIDTQHKKLVDIMNELHSAMKASKGKEILGNILDELVQYTKHHFTTEESIMAEHNYPGLKEHKAEHFELTQKVLDFQKQFHAGKVILSMDVMQFLREWLINHIMGTDKKYTPYLSVEIH